MSNSTKNAKGTVVESFKDIIPLSFGEEIGNSVSHGVAALLTLFLLPYAAVHSYIAHGTLSSVSISIFVISIFMMFISSTIYHAMKNNTAHKYMRTSWLFILFIVLGGLSYTIGAWFYAQKNRPYFHMIWHIFIVIASMFHLIAILYFI